MSATQLFNFSPLQAYVPVVNSQVSFKGLPFSQLPTAAGSTVAAQTPLAAPIKDPNKINPVYRFVISPTQKLLKELFEMGKNIWELLKAIIQRIARILGLNPQIREQKNAEGKVEGLEVQAEGEQSDVEVFKGATEGALNTTQMEQVAINIAEPLKSIYALKKDFEAETTSVTAFEESWRKANPELPLESARNTNVSPEITKYLQSLDSIKSIILQASLIHSKYPEFEDKFGKPLLDAIDLHLADIEQKDLEKLDPKQLAAAYAETHALIQSFGAGPEKAMDREMALDSLDKTMQAAVTVYEKFPEKRELLGADLLKKIEETKGIQPSDKDASQKNNLLKITEKASNVDSFVQESEKLISGKPEVLEVEKAASIAVNVIPISAKAAKPDVEFSAAAHLPGLSEVGGQGVVLPVAHVDSPRTSPDVTKSKFGAIAHKIKESGEGLGSDESPTSRDEIDARLHRRFEAPRP